MMNDNTENKAITILIVDDEEINLDIILEYLEDTQYIIICAKNGLEAWNILSEQKVDIVLLDRMMPIMDGMQLLEKMKAVDGLVNVPVIMQTAASGTSQVKEGIDAGVFYYLTKPYKKDILLSIIKSAIHNSALYVDLKEIVINQNAAMTMMKQGVFEFRTMDDIKNLSALIGACFSATCNILWGVKELMINAVEHGNLNISYEEKKIRLIEGNFSEEIEKRLLQEEYKNKKATLKYQKDEKQIIIIIEDQGLGFNWNEYMEIKPDRLTDPNGRGIALSNSLIFDKLEYSQNGNIVKCFINL